MRKLGSASRRIRLFLFACRRHEPMKPWHRQSSWLIFKFVWQRNNQTAFLGMEAPWQVVKAMQRGHDRESAVSIQSWFHIVVIMNRNSMRLRHLLAIMFNTATTFHSKGNGLSQTQQYAKQMTWWTQWQYLYVVIMYHNYGQTHQSLSVLEHPLDIFGGRFFVLRQHVADAHTSIFQHAQMLAILDLFM